jgi:hypothetical protein
MLKQSTLNFNREILLGECGALIMASPTSLAVSHFTRDPSIISSSAVAGTLVGGALFWLLARIYDKVREKSFNAKAMASDIGYFAPAAVILGFLVYDPSIYFTSRHLLKMGDKVGDSVLAGQLVAFVLFLLFMNVYRLLLLRVRGKSL